MKKISKALLTVTIAGSIILLAIPTGIVFAQKEAPPVKQHQDNRKQQPFRQDFSLDRLYQKLFDRFEDMGYRIQDTDDVTQRLENRIETLVENGEDPSDLQTIQDTFEDNMAAVEEAYEEVGSLLDSHKGFDDEGNVLDEELALATLRSIAEGLLDVHQLGENARLSLQWDLLEINYQNRSNE